MKQSVLSWGRHKYFVHLYHLGTLYFMKLIIALAATLASSVVFAQAPTQQAQPQCFKREEVTTNLMRQGASPVVAGLSGNPNLMLEIWEDKDGDWTLFQTQKRPDGPVMCPMISGKGSIRTAKQRCIDPIICPRV